ncbi:EF-hand domain-containing protein [Billgrantia diversa]|uniref:EF-hand domain-containing protein n=1 Tax=Halomonas sp. MCCC 1A13316 TaxID=2733487 RepID=UPI0018A37290|nr:EF-hand domain-containing protein [Halomonas sp. MCCC 1A13316]QOR37733.1 EF-hand domain-containing protein [Halomonas sp. MCCC 1A13316]
MQSRREPTTIRGASACAAGSVQKKTALFLALVLSSGVALAEMGAEELIPPSAYSNASGQNGFEQMDHDGDGRISHEEAKAGSLPEVFVILDRDHNGAISRQEFNFRPR